MLSDAVEKCTIFTFITSFVTLQSLKKLNHIRLLVVDIHSKESHGHACLKRALQLRSVPSFKSQVDH